LPGSLYIYQGDELGLDEVDDLPVDRIQDPMYFRSDGTDPGRDGCRVPIPWSGDHPPFGFSLNGSRAEPWLPQPQRWQNRTVEAEERDPDSMLHLYRQALRIRRSEPGLGNGPMVWLPSDPDVLSFSRGEHFVSTTNLSSAAILLPAGAEILIASDGIADGLLPVDATAWLRHDRGG
jgi:alpha-glucosidase